MRLPVIATAACLLAAGRGTSAARPDRCRRHHVHRFPLVSQNGWSGDSAGHLHGCAPGRAWADTVPPSACCVENVAASCRQKHPSADGY
jgi:hypothetical protein